MTNLFKQTLSIVALLANGYACMGENSRRENYGESSVTPSNANYQAPQSPSTVFKILLKDDPKVRLCGTQNEDPFSLDRLLIKTATGTQETVGENPYSFPKYNSTNHQ